MTLFVDDAAAVASLRADFALSAGELVDVANYPDAKLYSKLLAAEAEASRQLRVFLEPTVVIPDSAPQPEIDALEAAGTKYHQESDYEYPHRFFDGNRWGMIELGWAPAISVESISLSYPATDTTFFEIPSEWIRLDRKAGHVRLVPARVSTSLIMSPMIMSAIAAGRDIPAMIQVRYTSGLKNATVDYPDLVDTINKMAMLRVLQSSFLPSSGSISGDGLSQSNSVNLQEWHDGISDKLDDLRDAIHGIRCTVL